MSKDQMSRFVTNLLLDGRLAEAAENAGLAQRPEVAAQLAAARRDVLARSFVEYLLKSDAAKDENLEALARERYEVNKALYMRPEGVRTAHILVRVNPDDPVASDAAAKAKAVELHKQLRDGADFAELAKQHSEDTGSAERGGELPRWSDRGTLVPPYETAAYAMKPGEISDPVRSRFGYHIIKLLEYRPAQTIPFDEMKDTLIAEVRGPLNAQRRHQLLKPYQGTRPIQLDDATYEALRAP